MVLMANAAVVISCGWVAIFVISQVVCKRGGGRRRRRLSRHDRDSAIRGTSSIKVFPGWLSVETTYLNRKLQQWGFRYRRWFRLWYSIGTLFGTVGMALVVFILLWDACRAVLEWKIWYAGLERRADIQQHRPWTGPSSQVITPVIPGVNMPWGEVGYLWCATALAITIHELGHALAASAEGVRIEHVAFFLIVVFPGAWVALDAVDMDNKSPVRSLAIFSAGVWHNIAVSALCWVFLTSLSVFFTPFYASGVGLVVASIPESSPFLSHLHPGDVIFAIDRNPIGSGDAGDLKLKGLFSASVFGSSAGSKAATIDANSTWNQIVGTTVDRAGGTALGGNDSHYGWHQSWKYYGYCVPNSIWQGKEEDCEVKLDEDGIGYTNRWTANWLSAQAFVPNATVLPPPNSRDVSPWNKFNSDLHTESSGRTDGGAVGGGGGVGEGGGWLGNVIPRRMNLRSINGEWLLRDEKPGLDNLGKEDIPHSVGTGFASFAQKCEEKGCLVFQAIYCEEGDKMKGEETVEVAAGGQETTGEARMRDDSLTSGRSVPTPTHPPLRAVCLRATSVVSSPRCYPGVRGGSCECSLGGSACLVPKLHLGESLLRVSFICAARNSCNKAQHPRGRWAGAHSLRSAAGFVASSEHRNESAADADPRLEQQRSRKTMARHMPDPRAASVRSPRQSVRTFSDGHRVLKTGASRAPSGCAKVSQGYFVGRCESDLVFVGDPDVLSTALRVTEYYPRAWIFPHEWSRSTPSLLFLLMIWLPWGIKRLVISVFHVSIALALLNMAPVFGLDGEAVLNAWLMILMPGLSPRHHRQVMKFILWICTALLVTAILPPLVSLLVFP